MLEGFEWDEDKRQANIKKHGVDFVRVVKIFSGRIMEASDQRQDYGEARFRALGQIDGICYLVAYTVRGKNRRILSAWRLDDEGQRRYSTILNG